MTPTVSAVIPTYNYGKYVCEAVDSALAQTHPVEVVVVDDGSTDDTPERLAPYGDRIRVIRKKNGGLSAARNTGIREARGEWIALLDSDDYWHPRKTELQLACANRANVDFVGSRGHEGELPKELPDEPPVENLTIRDFLLRTPMAPSGAMIKKACFDQVGFFDESLRSVEDRDMWLRLSVKYPALAVDCRCVFYRFHQGQMSTHGDRMHKAFKVVLEKFFRDHPEHLHLKSQAYAFMQADAGIIYLDAGARWPALKLLAQSLVTHPVSLSTFPKLSTTHRLKLMVRAAMGQNAFARAQRMFGKDGPEPDVG